MAWLMSLPAWGQALLATLFTYGMTAAGAAFSLVSGRCSPKVLNAMQGGAAGIMVAASFFSLLLPAAEWLEGSPAWKEGAVLAAGFLAGALFIFLSGRFLEGREAYAEEKKRRGALTCFAVTLHNIPEGFAVGVAFGSACGEAGALVSAVMLAVGIGIQNFPEGLCVAVPLRGHGFSAGKAFFWGQLSGIVEVFAGVLGALAVGLISSLLPWALAFSAGAMIAVSCAELVPACMQEGKSGALLGIAGGFALMMFLDVFLG